LATWSSTTGTIPLTWQQWVGTTTGSGYTTYNTYVTNASSTTTYATWDRWREIGYIQEPIQWQQEIWGQWHEDDEENRRRLEELERQRDELQRQREQRSREQLAARQAAEERLAEARPRARELLEELVAPEEWVPELELIQVEGSDGQLYRIELHRRTVHGNIVRVDEHGCILGRACVAPEMYVDGMTALPTEDGWVGQYLGLKFDAATFLSHANWSEIHRGYQRVAA